MSEQEEFTTYRHKQILKKVSQYIFNNTNTNK